MKFGDEDVIELESRLVGSTHTTPTERSREDTNLWYGNVQTSQYERFSRPRLQLWKYKTTDLETGRKKYVEGDYVFVLPLAAEGIGSGAKVEFQPFTGRRVGRKVDLSLMSEWFMTCRGTHVTSNLGSNHARRTTSTAGCQPQQLPDIKEFRLVDVQERCIVNPKDIELQYVALSYVWGDCQRFLLLKNDRNKFYTPGSLSENNENVPATFRDAMAVAYQLGLRYLWIDAICILQDEETDLVKHMNAMNSIYGSATLTIVCDTDNANSGIPGIGSPRESDQAIFKNGNQAYISSKRTFGKALSDSPWESRAWCLQEKVFSQRLLVFTEFQMFYHCNRATWFEDTIMESKFATGQQVYIAERSSLTHKTRRSPNYTAYESHLPTFNEKNFWSLVEAYSLRDMSFESDAVRAFSGILSSLESEYGEAIWGVPRRSFSKGLTWSLSESDPDLRRGGFPSWSWAGWKGNAGTRLVFQDVLTTRGGVFTIEWYYHRQTEDGSFELTAVDDSPPPFSNVLAQRSIATTTTTYNPTPKRHEGSLFSWGSGSTNSTSLFVRTPSEPTKLEIEEKKSVKEEQPTQWEIDQKKNHTWYITGHPGEPDYVKEPLASLSHNPSMPPLSHILRFYTSTATTFVDPTHFQKRSRWRKHFAFKGPDTPSLPSTSANTKTADNMDNPNANEKKEENAKKIPLQLIYISRGFVTPSDDDFDDDDPELLNIMCVKGEGEVKYKDRHYGMVDIIWWRSLNPVWKLVTLA